MLTPDLSVGTPDIYFRHRADDMGAFRVFLRADYSHVSRVYDGAASILGDLRRAGFGSIGRCRCQGMSG